MICYRDMSFCCWSQVCQNKACPRNLNKEEIEKATKWWGGSNFPVMLADLQTKDCGAKI